VFDARPRIAVITNQSRAGQELARDILEDFQVDLYTDAEEAVRAIRSGRAYQGVFFDIGHFLQLLAAMREGLISKKNKGPHTPPVDPASAGTGLWDANFEDLCALHLKDTDTIDTIDMTTE